MDFHRCNIQTTNERLKNAVYTAFIRHVLSPFTANKMNNIKALEKVKRWPDVTVGTQILTG